ncbi:MAG: alpha/beta hydrolase-fold protein [Rhizomicrobium sp.]
MFGILALAGMVSLSRAEKDAYFEKPPQNTLHDCHSEPEPYGECRLPNGLTAKEIETRLAGKDTAWWRDGDQFVVIAKRNTDQAYLCCAARGRMDHVEGDDWALRLRIIDLDHATIDISVRPRGSTPDEIYRGPNAPAAFVRAPSLHGHFYPQAFESQNLDGARGISVYVPPGETPSHLLPVVYMADGNFRLTTPSVIEPLIESGKLPPMILVGIWSGNSHKADEDRRSEEYLLGWPNGYGYFLRHENFLLHELIPFVEKTYGASSDPKDRIITGFSSGAAWAVAMGIRHPNVFPTVIAQSMVWPGGYSPASTWQFQDNDKGLRFYLSAGTLEPEFYRGTLRFAEEARKESLDVQLETTVSGHTPTIWEPMLVHALQWAFAVPKKN